MAKIWKVKPSGNEKDIQHLCEVLNMDRTLAILLVQRGIVDFEQARAFFRPHLDMLHDPFLMKDMDKAIERLKTALTNKEKILIYGDYDVDGTTSVAMVYSFLQDYFERIDYYIPDRYAEGYGISFQGIDYAKETQCSLIIALDCGIKAMDKINYANELGIDFIICDHHTAGSCIPEAIAVLDPKRPDCSYPFKELSGCGVGFKLLQAFCVQLNFNNENIYKFLDLVCVSIGSDIVPITGENRILAFYGLKKLNSDPGTGLKSIIKISGLENSTITISDCVFKIGPRINAAGRIASGRKVVELLVSKNNVETDEIAIKINDFNTTRKNLDHLITKEALEIIDASEELKQRKTTVLFKNEWHKGVIGIVASRVTESYYRPTVILTESNGKATGSARSVEGFNLYNAIEACADLLEGYGGHMYAAGLTMKIENISAFSNKFEEVVSNTILPEQLLPILDIDTLLDIEEITPKFFRILKQLEPFGPENMTPVFLTKNVMDTGNSKVVGSTQEHLKLEVMHKDKPGKTIQGIAFSQAKFAPYILSKNPFDLCYSLHENEFKGNVSTQMMIRDIRESE